MKLLETFTIQDYVAEGRNSPFAFTYMGNGYDGWLCRNPVELLEYLDNDRYVMENSTVRVTKELLKEIGE